jgi:hypothetical protein
LLTVAISHITPQTQTPVAGETFIWVDTTDHNRPKTRGKTGWTYLQGDLSEAFSGFLVGLAREEGTYKSRFMGTNTLPVKTFRIYGAPNPRVFSPNAKPREGDYVIYARSDANAFNYMGAACARFEKGQWEMSSRLPYTMGNVLHGDVRCYIRVDGRESIREADWIWSNLQPDLLAVTYGVQAEHAAERRRSRITPVKPGTTDLSCGFQVLKPEHVDVYYLSPNARGRELLILDENYTVENLGVGKDGPTAKVVLKTPRLKAVGDRIHIAPAIPPAAEDDYGWDHPLPRGHVRLGDSASSPFTGTVNYFEARRQKGVYLHKQAIEVPATGVQHRFARRPSDPKTGRRDTPLLPAADVWATADK